MAEENWIPVARVKVTGDNRDDLNLRLRCYEIAVQGRSSASDVWVLARAKFIYEAIVEDSNWTPQDRRG